jgi:aspartate/methionine/tyrosine aminotransferase
MHALGVCFRAILERDDEVLVPAPCFFFDEPIRAAGGVPVHVHGSAETAWAWDAAALEHAVRPTTRALLLCNPVNPTGHVPARDEVQAVIAVAARHDLLVVTDEAYEASLWDGGALSSAYGAAPRAILIRSLGKSLSMPQLRLGLLAGPPAEIERCARVLEWDCLRVGLAAQVAALAALVGPTEWLEVVHASMVRSRDMALAAVGDVSGLSVVAPSGGPFLFVGADGRESLAEELLAVGLPVVDGRHFHASGFARLPFGGAEGACDALVAALAAYAERRASRRR